MEQLDTLLNSLEENINLNQSSSFFMYQPTLLSLSSDNSITKVRNAKNDSYSSFTVSLKRPIINVKSIQLVSANIPQCKGYNFNDTELVFPYYRLRTQENIANETYYTDTPNINTLYYVRLLPSYYPPELIPNAQNYGFNKTFNNYQELSDELQKATSSDLFYTNFPNQSTHFIPNDISITYNTTYNKFQMTGNATTWTPSNWSMGTNYMINDLVTYNDVVYISEVNNNINLEPDLHPSDWSVYTGTTTVTYLIAGYDDPNLQLLYQQPPFTTQALENITNNPDFFYNLYSLPPIEAIPVQPTRIGKTLAKRLGFTWNGSGMNFFPSGNTNTPITYAIGATNSILLYNRLRPIPQYEIDPPLLGDPPANNNPYTQRTYIAENFCNLVLSSIINIYSDLTNVGTFDTQSDKLSILSIIGIDVAPLGVIFSNDFLDNPIYKLNRDIYSITFTLTNEYDEPYFISENGIITLMFKMTY